METLVWLRVPGDIVFAAGSLFLASTRCLLRRPAREQMPAGAIPAAAKR
jgi:nitric oxide reductase subunit B